MTGARVVVTDNYTPYFEHARAVIEAAGAELIDAARAAPPGDPLAPLAEADALLVVWLPVTEAVLSRLKRCRVIVRCGIGYDNIDLAAARARGVTVCNVPDYCIDEVADHALALALALARGLPRFDRRLREGAWEAPAAMPAFREMTFGTVGFGRIARAVQERAGAFGFRRAASDPYAPDAAFAAAGVARRSPEELFAEADILSLHAPLSAETRHLVNRERLARMKPGAILVNTARGPLVDTAAVAEALAAGRLAGAGLDVFEAEPLPADHPLRACPNALLTPHVAWYSDRSAARLYAMAAEEALRVLRGEPPRSRVNP